jgi:hypothetical protein
MFIRLIGNIFRTMENLVNKGDNYYGQIIKISHIINFVYIGLFTFFGIYILKFQLLDTFNTIIQMLVCSLLLFKFHPFREHDFKQSDSTLIFSSAVFLLFNLSIIEFLNRYTSKVGLDISKHAELIHATGEIIIDEEEV